MFTGLIDNSGVVGAIDQTSGGTVLRIETELAQGLVRGDSIAVNGVCLTATSIDDAGFSADVMAESLARTALGELSPGSQVNLERPLAIGERLDGHIVQGHVDGVGEISSLAVEGFSSVVRVELPDGLGRYVVEKGSIAIDGISLTVSGVGDDWLEVSLIPETQERTTLGDAAIGDRVNLEVDVLAKHVERLLQHQSTSAEQTDA